MQIQIHLQLQDTATHAHVDTFVDTFPKSDTNGNADALAVRYICRYLYDYELLDCLDADTFAIR